MVPLLEKAGHSFVGKDESGRRMEVYIVVKTVALIFNMCLRINFIYWMQIIELPNHVFFIGAQFHPEFKSRPGKPSPLFLGNTKL